MQHTAHIIYQNKACLEYFGLPRTADDIADEMDKLTDEVRLRRRTRLKSILLVRPD